MRGSRVLLDACVLVPTTLRDILLGVAAEGSFAPVWSARILEEWALATRRLPPGAEAVARAEIASMRARWPGAEAAADPDLEPMLALPDPDDRHVLAAAITARADVLLTLNRRDFSPRTLARHGVIPREPDGFLCDLIAEGSGLAGIVDAALARRAAASGAHRTVRSALKRAGLPRLAKALAARPGHSTD